MAGARRCADPRGRGRRLEAVRQAGGAGRSPRVMPLAFVRVTPFLSFQIVPMIGRFAVRMGMGGGCRTDSRSAGALARGIVIVHVPFIFSASGVRAVFMGRGRTVMMARSFGRRQAHDPKTVPVDELGTLVADDCKCPCGQKEQHDENP